MALIIQYTPSIDTGATGVSGWANAFDEGVCNVRVVKYRAEAWSGVLAKGESSPTFDSYSRVMQISVDLYGNMTLSCSDTDYAAGFTVTCEPQYSMTGARASDIVAMGVFAGYASFGVGVDDVSLAFGVDGSGIPDPAIAFGAVPTVISVSANGGS